MLNTLGTRAFGALLLLAGAADAGAQTPRVLLVGDSWAAQQFGDGVHALVFAANGAGQYGVAGTSTTESGSTAAQWASPARLALIEQALLAEPGIDTVQLTIGGNDFLDAWSTGLDPLQVLDLQEQIRIDLETVTAFVLSIRPDIEVVLSFYDYPNFRDTLGGLVGLFFCRPLHEDLGQPTPQQLNEAATAFEGAYAQLAAHPRVHHVSHAGQMQFTFGFPSEGIPAGQLLPPGDLARPSPLAAMRNLGVGRDCFHLSPAGYDVLVQNLYDNYFAVRFETIFRSSLE
jgi:lysophospholipase L1-like esterase